MSTVKSAIENRYSARHLDPSKKIDSALIDQILDAGRKAPSGFGSEPWQFYVVDGDLSKLSEATYGQPHVPNASHAIVITTYKKALLTSHPEVLTKKFQASGYSEDQIARSVGMLEHLDADAYFKEQAAFAATQMVLQATELGIGTVIMSGIDPVKLADVLGVDKENYNVSLFITLGFATDEKKRDRLIRSYDEVVRKITL